MLMDHCGEFIQNSTCTPISFYYMFRYNAMSDMFLDVTLISVGPQSVMKDFFCYIPTFYFTITNTEIGLDPNNSVIKRLYCNV